MKNVLQISVVIILAVLLIGAGCVSVSVSAPSPEVSATAPPISSPCATPTPTAIPRPTLTPTPMPTVPPTATPTLAPQPTVEWLLPQDKYVFIERGVTRSSETSDGRGTGFLYIDVPMYQFYPKTKVLISRSGESRTSLAGEGLVALKVAYGRGTQRTGTAGTGMSSRIIAVTEIPFTDFGLSDTDAQVRLRRVDADGVAL